MGRPMILLTLLLLLAGGLHAQTDDGVPEPPVDFYAQRERPADEQWAFVLTTLDADYAARQGTAGSGFTHQRALLAQMAYDEPYIDAFIRHMLVYIAVDGLNRDAEEGLLDPVETALTESLQAAERESTRLTLHDLGNAHTGLKHFRHELLPGFTIEADRQIRAALENGTDVNAVVDAIRLEHTRFLLEVIAATPPPVVAAGEMSEVAATGTQQVAEVLSPIFREAALYRALHDNGLSYSETLPVLQEAFDTAPEYAFFAELGVDGAAMLRAGAAYMDADERDAYFVNIYADALADYMDQTRLLAPVFRLNGLDQATVTGFVANVDALETEVLMLFELSGVEQ